ncbi:MAG: hypothetical protein GY774_05760 [Planctomycetes bacterium]|nr:hypothetical protein [Planctomycetota bacterium]
MKNVLRLLALFFLLPGAAQADPKIVLYGAYNTNTQVCTSSNLQTCGATFIALDGSNLPNYFEQMNHWTDLCEAVAQTGYSKFYRDGSNNDAVSPNTWYIYTDGSFCKTGQTSPNATNSNGASGWIGGEVRPNGAQIRTGYPNDTAECAALGGTRDGYGQCWCTAGQVVDSASGCADDNQCDTTAIPPTSRFSVNIFTSIPPTTICVDNCQLTGGSIMVGLPYSSHSIFGYTASGNNCAGGEFEPQATDYTQGDPAEPTCRTVDGAELCYDPATNCVTKNGGCIWDFDQGDYYDGVCSITSSGGFVCGDYATIPGTNNDDTPPVQIGVDTDSDGIPDLIIIDDTADGLTRIVPGTRIDSNGDGSTDSIAVDSNNDGISDSIVADRNGDGTPDHDDPSTPDVNESNPDGNTGADPNKPPTNGGNGNDVGDCVDNLNTPWNECDTDNDGGGDNGSGTCTDDPNTPWNDCSVGVDLDGCNKSPEVTGDPIQAAALFLAWQDACSAYVPPEQKNNGLDLQDSRTEDDGSFLKETFDIASSLDDSGFLGASSGLPDYDLTIMGESYTLHVSEWEPFLEVAGSLLIVMTLLFAGRLLVDV